MLRKGKQLLLDYYYSPYTPGDKTCIRKALDCELETYLLRSICFRVFSDLLLFFILFGFLCVSCYLCVCYLTFVAMTGTLIKLINAAKNSIERVSE